MSARFTLKKTERLKQKKLIDNLFKSNKEIYSYPIKLIYNISNEKLDSKLKAGVSVSSRNFKKAVDRNTLKRRMREAYRLNKSTISEQLSSNDKSLIIMFLYVSKNIEDFEVILSSIKFLLGKLNEKLSL